MTLTADCYVKALRHIADADGLKANIKGSLLGSIGIGVVALVCSVILGRVFSIYNDISMLSYSYVCSKALLVKSPDMVWS